MALRTEVTARVGAVACSATMLLALGIGASGAAVGAAPGWWPVNAGCRRSRSQQGRVGQEGGPAAGQGQARAVDQRPRGASRIHPAEPHEPEVDLPDRRGRARRQEMGIRAPVDARGVSPRGRPFIPGRGARGRGAGLRRGPGQPGGCRSSTGTVTSSGTSSSITTSNTPTTTRRRCPTAMCSWSSGTRRWPTRRSPPGGRRSWLATTCCRTRSWRSSTNDG